nr:hypothetical protein CFP56_13023 [Quercus suber]
MELPSTPAREMKLTLIWWMQTYAKGTCRKVVDDRNFRYPVSNIPRLVPTRKSNNLQKLGLVPELCRDWLDDNG